MSIIEIAVVSLLIGCVIGILLGLVLIFLE